MIIACLVEFIVAFMLAYLATRKTSLLYIPDIPNHRSLHDSVVSRSGGIAIFISFYIIYYSLARDYLGNNHGLTMIITLSIIVWIISLLDDMRGLPPFNRLLVHFAVAILLWYSFRSEVGVALLDVPGHIVFAITVLSVVWFINLYNFMDGLDGLAGSMSLVGFSTLALFGYLADSRPFFYINLLILIPVIPFLIYNWPKARLFMGDSGASTMGYLAIALVFYGSMNSVFTIWTGILVFAPFWMDATLTLAQRVLRNERVWEAHKNHIYQRLADRLLGGRATLRFYVMLMLLASVAAYLSWRFEHLSIYIYVAWVLLYTTLKGYLSFSRR